MSLKVLQGFAWFCNLVSAPKRKCSFSSVSEFRYLAEGGKTSRTFLFPLEAPSPTTPTSQEPPSLPISSSVTPPASIRRAKFRGTNSNTSTIDWSSRDTDHSSIFAGYGSNSSPFKRNGFDITSNPMFDLGMISKVCLR